MKFSLGFSAMALAADNQAPVISLDLTGMVCSHGALCPNQGITRGSTNLAAHEANSSGQSFADESEVFSNSQVNSAEPSASAMDHHQSAITVTTSYILFVRSNAHNNVEECATRNAACFGGTNSIDSNQRGEYVIVYDSSDASGNDAETLSFALVLVDTVAPTCHGTMTPECNAGFEGTLEITCAMNRQLFVASTVDAYDGILSPDDSSFDVSIIVNGIEVAEYENGTGQVSFGQNAFSESSQEVRMEWAIASADFAGVFGSNNSNNVYTESGTIILRDTVIPVIVLPVEGAPAETECGDIVETFDATYTDCFDDDMLSSVGRPKRNIETTCTGGVIQVEIVDGVAVYAANCETAGGCDVTTVYTVLDHWSNTGTDSLMSRTIDTLAPTLHITQLVATGSVATADNGDICAYGHTPESLRPDVGAHDHYWSHCESFAHVDGFNTYMHTDMDMDVTEYSAVLDATAIQHSAGSNADYNAINDLTSQGTAYSCSDKCSTITTSTAVWHNSSCGAPEGNTFDSNVVGTYFLKYTCNDGAGHAISACRTIVNVDKTRPVITVLLQANYVDGRLYVEASRSTNYVDNGALCNDVVDGDISSEVEVSGDVVNLAVLGTYFITYACQDVGGNDAENNFRTVVVEDTTCPYCDYTGDEPAGTQEASFPYTAVTAACTDTMDGTLDVVYHCTGAQCVDGDIDVEHTGTYVITWSATDGENNGAQNVNIYAVPCPADALTKTVVVEDTLTPSIKLDYKGSTLHEFNFMAESSSVNGWVIGAVASAVSGVALLGYAATRKSAAAHVPV